LSTRPLDAPSLLENGFQPESVAEAYQMIIALLEQDLPDRAAEALERAHELLRENPTIDDLLMARLRLAAWRTALARGDGAAVNGVNQLLEISGVIPAAELELVVELARSDRRLHPNIRSAFVTVLEAIVPGPEVPASVRGVDLGEGMDPFDLIETEDDDLPWIDFEAERDESLQASATGDTLSAAAALVRPTDADAGGTQPMEGPHAGAELVEAVEAPDGVLSGGASVESLRKAFVAQGDAAAINDPRRAFEMACTLMLIEDYDSAAALFAKVYGEHRDAALEGFVRCKLGTGNPRAALTALADARSHFEGGQLPDALRYWEGRSAEAAGDLALARTAYRGLPDAGFPDARHRLRALAG
jgi:tetratricopeptide (TPR) repeat protein